MAKLPRVAAKIFASNADENDIGQYGSALTGNKVLTANIAEIQALPAYETGWRGAVLSTRNYPTLQEMNGLQKTFSQQLAYLLNNGVAEYDANTTYYQGDIVKVINDGIPVLKYSVIDDNIGNDTDNTDYWTDLISNADIAIATNETPGIVQPDGTSITITEEGIISSQGANKDLSNLTASGNAKFQYAPFSVNNGTVDKNGNNAVLYLPEGTAPVDVSFVPPVLTSNGTLGGDDFAVDASSYTRGKQPYYLFATGITDNYYQSASGNPQWYTFYNPDALKVKKITLQNYNGNMYSISSGTIYASNDNTNWTKITDFTSPSINPNVYWDIDLSGNENYFNYYKIDVTGMSNSSNGIIIQTMKIDAVYLAQISSSSNLLSAPCTITTSDNRTKMFEYDNILDCSSFSDGTYKVMKNYTDGSLSLVSDIYTGKTKPSFVQPVLSENGTIGGDSFAVSGTYYSGYPVYYAFDGNTSTRWQSDAVTGNIIFYNPSALNVTNIKITNTEYSGQTIIKGYVQGSNDNNEWTTLTDFTNSVVTAGGNWNIDLSGNTGYYKYHKLVSENTYNNSQGISNYSYSGTGELTVTAYTEQNGDIWLDTSQYPLTLKQYNGNEWVVNNDLVYMGDVTITSGVVTAVRNNEFNKYGYLLNNYPVMKERYTNGTSWYRLYSDGWCEQGGLTYAPQTITLLKAYKDDDYSVITSSGNGGITTVGGAVDKTASTFYLYLNGGSGTSYLMYWRASGYVN